MKIGGVKLFEIRYALESDKAFWLTHDEHISENELLLKIRDRRGYIISDEDKTIGVLRYNLFLDIIPFLTMIYLDESYRGKGFGRQAMLFWEHEMCELGYKMIMTSTQVDEGAQHFYRKLGYKDRGSLFLDNTPFEQPQELFMLKIF
jgi:ribosomal protein S18 acetylase RimI-like enzyme